LCRHVAGGRWFQCLITDDRELQRLNRQFLGKNYPADVLSFPVKENAETLGDIAISYQRAREQARAFGHSVKDEVCILMLHGVLHLVGMDHERDRGAMARAEIAWRNKLELPAGLIERVSA
jgi:probable rRNA maturation factor